MIESRRILGVRVDATDYATAKDLVITWAEEGRPCYVCLGAVNNIMEARDSPAYRRVMEQAALVTSDGMPLVWLLRALGIRKATRVYGPSLTSAVLADAAHKAVPVGFYGGSERVLARLLSMARMRFPGLNIVFAESPPFRTLTTEEDERITGDIIASGARILFVGLGSPKQDRWMSSHRDRLSCVMLGVGAAFDFLSGTKPQAPAWMQRNGLEWVFRLATEPRRLWRRYLKQNPRFAVLAFAQLLRTRFL